MPFSCGSAHAFLCAASVLSSAWHLSLTSSVCKEGWPSGHLFVLFLGHLFLTEVPCFPRVVLSCSVEALLGVACGVEAELALGVPEAAAQCCFQAWLPCSCCSSRAPWWGPDVVAPFWPQLACGGCVWCELAATRSCALALCLSNGSEYLVRKRYQDGPVLN